MKPSTSLVAFGTFGNPHGFKQTFFIGNSELSTATKTFDLNTNAIKLTPGAAIYAIRHEKINELDVISYAVYAYAKEQGSDRSGTFLGSALLFTGKLAPENITITLLNDFQKSLMDANVKNDSIQVNHSDHLKVRKPKDFDKLAFQLKDFSGWDLGGSTRKSLVVYCETNPVILQQYLSKSLALLGVYDTIYFTQNHEVAEYVGQKRLFNLVESKDFDLEINKVQAELQHKRETAITLLEDELRVMEVQSDKTLKGCFQMLENKQRIHQENEKKITALKRDIEHLKQFFSVSLQKNRDLIKQLKTGKKIEEVKVLSEENKKKFEAHIQKVRTLNPLVGFQSPDMLNGEEGEDVSEENAKNPYKAVSFILGVLLVLTWFYFLVYKKDKPTQLATSPHAITADSVKPAQLIPLPNAELADFLKLQQKIPQQAAIDQVVNLIFDENPDSIKSYYLGQKDLYEKELLKLNQNCFELKEGVFYFTKDTIKHIPLFKP